jgi:DNA-binding CsgD family transcriptional regulator
MIEYLATLLFQHQKKIERLAIFLLCLTISFRIENFNTQWLWNGYAFVGIVLVMILIVVALIWIRIEKHKTRVLMEAIKDQTTMPASENINQLDDLSARQKEVFDLILKGKSNKEIMDELSIELSTLKTHINKIYKILDIDSRKQLKKFKNEGF